MIYIYRFLWMVFYMPIFVLELILFGLGIPFFIFVCAFYYVKTGDVENTPDIFIPLRLVVWLDDKYKELQK